MKVHFYLIEWRRHCSRESGSFQKVRNVMGLGGHPAARRGLVRQGPRGAHHVA